MKQSKRETKDREKSERKDEIREQKRNKRVKIERQNTETKDSTRGIKESKTRDKNK